MVLRGAFIRLAVLGSLLILWSGVAASDPPTAVTAVAIDPGHGGKDLGARGGEGVLEKQVCLSVAQRLADIMEPGYKVALTRSDDYNVPLMERTAVANNQKADLFISLHTAASFVQTGSGIHIYTYKPVSDEASKAIAQRIQTDAAPVWRQLQLKHLAASELLAESLRQAFEGMSGAPSVSTHKAPLVVLEGADMPAVVIEIGHLTNPAVAADLNTHERQDRLARIIAGGIDRFLAEGRAKN